MNDEQRLLGSLAYWVTAGKLKPSLALPAIQNLAGAGLPPKSLLELLESLESETDATLLSLVAHLRDTLRQEALRFYERRKRGEAITEDERTLLVGLVLEPAGKWNFGNDPGAAVERAVHAACDLSWMATNREKAPRLFEKLKSHADAAVAAAGQALDPLFANPAPDLLQDLETAWPAGWPGREEVLGELRQRRRSSRGKLLERARQVFDQSEMEKAEPDDATWAEAWRGRFTRTSSRTEQKLILDLVCAGSTPGELSVLKELAAEAWAQDRVVFNLTLRFGQPQLVAWPDWVFWLGQQENQNLARGRALNRLIERHPTGLLLILYTQQADPDPAGLDALVRMVANGGAPVNVPELVQAWSVWVTPGERRALLGLPEPVPPPLPPVIRSAVEAPEVKQPDVPPAPPQPSFWEKHLQPLFVENWYIVAGIAMVILGSSLLAYYTWDKHWLMRYTIMPALLAFFTWSLAGAGQWIERKGAEFRSTAAILRCAAIGLLPINFMAMALLSADQQVPRKGMALVVMGFVYLSAFGWGLRKWCAAVEPSLRNLLAGTLLALNFLVAVGPLGRTVGHLEGQPLLICLGAGFYLGFALTAGTIVQFCRKILTRQMAEEKRVPWFIAAALTITYAQVFIWVHGFLRHTPRAHTYALLVICAGWLVLYAERRALALRESPHIHGGESFLGFALVMLGLLMGFYQPTVRIASFAVAGIVWLYQAAPRKHVVHGWIALTLFGLAVAAIGLLPRFPGPWLPALGLGAAVGFGLGGRLCRARGQEELGRACVGMQVVAVVLTTIVAPLAQWHYGSEPLATAGWLILAAALLAWRALKDQQIHWLHATMLVLALALPYAGCVDMAHRTAHHNTMVFGLAILSMVWLGVTRWIPRPLILQARSTVLWFYGILAVAAMLLRVVLGDTAPEALWYRDFMDYTGPILMMIVLIPATFYSRSLVPAGMAVLIMAVLFPELKANLRQTFPWLSWGSGLASSLWGLGLAALCFFLRRWPFLQNLPEGDRFLGKELFPLRRNDHTLYTLPVLAAALFLMVKVDTWNLLRNLGTGVPIKTAIALVLTGAGWTIVAVYRREHRSALIGVHLGWICGLAGIGLGYWHAAVDPYWTWPFLITGLLLQGLYWLYRFALEPTQPWSRALLIEPMGGVLRVGSGILACVCIVSLIGGAPLTRLVWLELFLPAQLIWHGLATRQRAFGAILFFEVWISLLAATAPGTSALWSRVSPELSATPTFWLLIGVQLLLLALEAIKPARPSAKPANAQAAEATPPLASTGSVESERSARVSLYENLAPVVTPPFLIASLLTFLLGLAGVITGGFGLALSIGQHTLLLGALLLTARAHSSCLILLPGMLLGYEMIHHNRLFALAGAPLAQVELLATPWRLALFGLVMVLVTQAGRRLRQLNPQVVSGPFAQRFFVAPSCGWIFWPAMVFATLAALYHTVHPGLREITAQLWAPYLGATTFALVAWFWPARKFHLGAGGLLILGNIHLVRVFGGDFLRAHGLSELHLICLGLGLTLVQSSALRRWNRAAHLVASINLASLALAGAILALLSANYFTEPNIGAMSSTRFVVSGTLAWLAGWYFRRAARHPGPGETAHVDLCESLYHFGVVISMWCAAFWVVSVLAPGFPLPLLTLIVIGLPVGWLYARAEFGMRAGLSQARRYRNSAEALGFVVLALYVSKGVFQLLLFPGLPVSTQHYHYNAPLVMVLGIVLLRLHGLGGTSWLAFYGGLALMTGSYFLLTSLPGLSPFDYPMPSAWSALGLGHFWILLSYTRSPLRTFIQRISKVTDQDWLALRRSWGRCLAIATQGVMCWGIADYDSNTYLVAPLLGGGATILIHLGIIRSKDRTASDGGQTPSGLTSGGARGISAMAHSGIFYFLVAALELVVALHMDFLVHSYLPKSRIVWAILLIWAGLLATYQVLRHKITPELVGRIALPLAALVLAHVFYHGPSSAAGLWSMALGGILAAANPQQTRQAGNVATRLCAALLLWVPTWLVYFSQRAGVSTPGIAGETWPALAATASLLLTGIFARLFPTHLAAGYDRLRQTQPRLLDSTLTWLCAPIAQGSGPRTENAGAGAAGWDTVGARIHTVLLSLALVAVCAVQVLHYQSAFAPREFSLLILIEATLAVAWFYEGRGRDSMLAYCLMQASVAICAASIRRHLMLILPPPWNYEYDVWASLILSFGLVGARQVFGLESRALRVPWLSSVLILPAVALVWVLVHGLGANMALLLVGLHSVMFAYLGRGERESPYNILALTGFVAFILLTFSAKLHLLVIHAYVIPVGIGILVLQELFRERIRTETRNAIRLITLLLMVGNTGYYALADPRYPVAFNLTMIILCLAAMGLGSFLRIRLYLALGFVGLLVDLVSLLYKALVHMERNARMTVIGSLVLVLGAAVVFGAVYYKTNKDVFDAWLDRWRRKLGTWE